MELKTIAFSCAVAVSVRLLPAAVLTNAWLSSEGGNVTNLVNWSYFQGQDNPMFDGWGKYSFGFLDLRKMKADETLTTKIDVRVDGFWVAPCESETAATTVVSRVERDGCWKPEDESVFCVEEGATLWIDSPLKPTADGNFLRKTGDGALVLRTALGGSRVDIQAGTCEFFFDSDNIDNQAAQAFTVNRAGVDALRISTSERSAVYAGGVVDPYGRAETPDWTDTAVWFGPGQSYLATLGTNGWLGSRAAGLLRLAQVPPATGLALEDGDMVLDALPSDWAAWNCIGYWRFEVPGRPGADSGPWANELVAQGTLPVVTNDAVRGSVAWFDGTAGLAGFWRDDGEAAVFNQPRGCEPYTFAAWIKVAAEDVVSEQPQRAICKFGNLVEAQCQTLGIRVGNDGFRQQHGGKLNADWKFPLGTTVADGTWHHVAIVFDGLAGMTYYWDGTQCATSDWSAVGITTDLKAQEFQIGCSWSEYAQNFRGMMDDVAFFRSALSAEDVGTLKDATIASVAFAADQHFRFTGTGVAHVFGEQRIDRLGSDANDIVRGGFELNGAGATLVLDSDAQGTNRTWTVWDGTIRGDGGVVKEGARSELVLTGVGDYRGPTEIKAGTVRLRGTGSDLVAHWTFDDPRHPYANVAQRGFDLEAGNESCVAVVDDPERGRVLKLSADGQSPGGYLQGVYPGHFVYSNDAFTVALWAKVSRTAPKGGTFVVWGRDGAGLEQLQFRLWDLDSYDRLAFSFYSLNHAAKVSEPLNDDAWHHLAITYESNGTVATYLDGNAVAMEKAGVQEVKIPRDGKLMLGNCWSRDNVRYLDGCLDDVRIYQRALTAAEVAALAQNDVDPVVGPAHDTAPDELPAPLAHWSYDNPDDIGHDDTGNGHDLVVSGTGVSTQESPVRGRMASFADRAGGLVYDRDGSTFPAGLPSGGDNLTFTTWFRADAEESIPNNTALVYWGPSDSGGKAFIVDASNDGRALRFVTLATNGVGTTQSVAAYATGDAFRQGNDRQRLHHLAAVQDNTARTFTLYIDGRKVGETQIPKNTATASTAENFSLGRRMTTWKGWKGMMDETKIYGVALTQTQVVRAMRAEMALDAFVHALPADATPVVSSGAALVLEGRDQTLAGVTGVGRLGVHAGTLTVTGQSTFYGALEGTGTIALAAGAVFDAPSGAAAFGGTLELRGGRTTCAWPSATATLPLDVELPLAAAPYATVGGRLVVGAAGRIVRTDGTWTSGTYELATAGEIVLPDAPAEGWSVLPEPPSGWKAKLVVRRNTNGSQTLCLRLVPSATLLIFR